MRLRWVQEPHIINAQRRSAIALGGVGFVAGGESSQRIKTGSAPGSLIARRVGAATLADFDVALELLKRLEAFVVGLMNLNHAPAPLTDWGDGAVALTGHLDLVPGLAKLFLPALGAQDRAVCPRDIGEHFMLATLLTVDGEVDAGAVIDARDVTSALTVARLATSVALSSLFFILAPRVAVSAVELAVGSRLKRHLVVGATGDALEGPGLTRRRLTPVAATLAPAATRISASATLTATP